MRPIGKRLRLAVVDVYNLRDLRANFDVASVMDAWCDKRLENWLELNRIGDEILAEIRKSPDRVDRLTAMNWLVPAFFDGAPGEDVLEQMMEFSIIEIKRLRREVRS